MSNKDKKGHHQVSLMQEGYADCSTKCCSAQHASQLNVAVTLDISEEEIIAWIARHCYAPGKSRDQLGRSVLHLAASCGRLDLCNWLLTYKGASLNGRDKESGYTSLHRSVIYGQIQAAIFFIKQGANIALTDNNGYTALDLLHLDKPPHVTFTKTAPLETYVWGSNSNYNLGTGDNSTRNNADVPDFFRKQNISIKKVALQKFHSGFLSSTGVVYTCGHGRGGRLGIGSETMLLAPKSVQIGACIDIALGMDHSLFLAQSGVVYTCGENTYHQLGHCPPPPRLLAPSPVGTKKPAKGVAAARYHSVFWTDTCVYTWGLNAGQLGHIKGDKTVMIPTQVTSYGINDVKITQVAVSDGATVLCTNKGDVIALHAYNSKKIGAKQHGIQKVEVTGGHLDPGVDPGGCADIDFKLVAGGGAPLKIFILRLGQVLVWSEGKDKNFLTCTLAISRPQPLITELAIFRSELLLVTDSGDVFQGTITQSPVVQVHGQSHKAASHSPGHHRDRFLPSKQHTSKDPLLSLKVKRIAGIHRAVQVSADPKGRNFCVLQVSPLEALTELPEVRPSNMLTDLTNLFNQVSEDDGVHDVICVVNGVRFPAHSAILAASSDYISKKLKYMEDDTSPVTIQIPNLHPVIFRQLLEFIYTKRCTLLQEGPCAVTITSLNDDSANIPNEKREVKIMENVKKVDMIELEENENPATVSAYAVYEKNRKKKARDLKKADAESNERKRSTNPLYLLQEAAKQLGVYGLAKIVDCYRYHEGSIYEQRSKPRTPSLEFNNENLLYVADVTLIAEDGVEMYAHKSILVARSEYFCAMLTSGWLESKEENHLNLSMKSCYLEAILHYLYKDDSSTLSKCDDIEFISNLLVHADQLLLVRLKEQCESELSRLITLRNVADMLDFTYLYMADQLKVSCIQFVVLNIGCLLEAKALDKLDQEILSDIDKYYRASNNKVAARKIVPCQGFPDAKSITEEFENCALPFEHLIEYEEKILSAAKNRPRRHSSGDKRKSPKLRSRTSSIMSSGTSGSEDEDNLDISQDMDRLSLFDFQIEEKEERSPEPADYKIKSGKAGKCEDNIRDNSYFSNLLAGAPSTKDAAGSEENISGKQGQASSPSSPESPHPNLIQKSAWKSDSQSSLHQLLSSSTSAPKKHQQDQQQHPKESKSKKFPKLSQKERKKMSERKQNGDESVLTSPGTQAKSWLGWSHQQTSDSSPQLSLSDIMASQKIKSNDAPQLARQNSSGADGAPSTRERKSSEGAEGGKSSRRNLWKQVDLSVAISPTKDSPSLTSPGRAGNPWKVGAVDTGSPVSTLSLGELLKQDPNNKSFQQIMEDDVQEERNLNQIESKPLHVLQLEEQAMLELHQLYSLQYPDEVITVQRVDSGCCAKPVWNYKTS